MNIIMYQNQLVFVDLAKEIEQFLETGKNLLHKYP